MVIDEVERGMIGFSFSLRDTRGRGTEEGEGVVCEEEEEEDEEAEVVEVEAMEREGKEDPEAGEVVQESDSTGRKKDRRVFCFITRRSERKSKKPIHPLLGQSPISAGVKRLLHIDVG